MRAVPGPDQTERWGVPVEPLGVPQARGRTAQTTRDARGTRARARASTTRTLRAQSKAAAVGTECPALRARSPQAPIIAAGKATAADLTPTALLNAPAAA